MFTPCPAYTVLLKVILRFLCLDLTNKQILDRLKQLYNDDIESLEVWPAGMLETTEQGLPGPLFTAIIKDQFQRIRDGDRFWYENWRMNG